MVHIPSTKAYYSIGARYVRNAITEYRALLSLRNIFPRETNVLNIFGNLENGTNSDGDVTNASAKSLKYLINGRAKSCQELMIRGRGGQHSALHNNSQVTKALIRFIW